MGVKLRNFFRGVDGVSEGGGMTAPEGGEYVRSVASDGADESKSSERRRLVYVRLASSIF